MSTPTMLAIALPLVFAVFGIVLGVAAFGFACLCFLFGADTNDPPIRLARILLAYASILILDGVFFAVLIGAIAVFIRGGL